MIPQRCRHLPDEPVHAAAESAQRHSRFGESLDRSVDPANRAPGLTVTASP